MKLLLALDPSINSAGLAFFYDGKLINSVTVGADSLEVSCLAHRCMIMADEIRAYIGRNFNRWTQIDTVFEWPMIYPKQRGKRPNDLPALAGVGMAVAAMFPGELHSYYPAEWAGQIPKAKTKAKADSSPRALRIKSRLSPEEMKHWPSGQHDAIDAIGIGLHHLGRLERKRVYPGASE